jgi:hypothetical protein
VLLNKLNIEIADEPGCRIAPVVSLWGQRAIACVIAVTMAFSLTWHIPAIAASAQVATTNKPAGARAGGHCYRTKRPIGEPRFASMPGVCRALAYSLNATCDVPQRPFRLAIPKPAAGLALPAWENLPLSDKNVTLLESLVRSRWQDNFEIAVQKKAGFATRMDWEWAVVRRAIERARAQGLPMKFERASFPLVPGRAPTTYYRFSIDAPENGTRVNGPESNDLERKASELVGPEMYTSDPGVADPNRPNARSRTESLTGAGQEFVLYQLIPFVVSIDWDGTYHVQQIGIRNESEVGSFGVCDIQRVGE